MSGVDYRLGRQESSAEVVGTYEACFAAIQSNVLVRAVGPPAMYVSHKAMMMKVDMPLRSFAWLTYQHSDEIRRLVSGSIGIKASEVISVQEHRKFTVKHTYSPVPASLTPVLTPSLMSQSYASSPANSECSIAPARPPGYGATTPADWGIHHISRYVTSRMNIIDQGPRCY
jgi:hypothetical protein